jgi:hypothetical protein
MAHFAEIKNNIVQRVIVVNNEVINDAQGLDGEVIGIAFCKSLYGDDTEWKQTSYSGSFRGRFAGLDFIWDETTGEFLVPLEEETFSTLI